MGTITGSTLIGQASQILHDEAGVRWSSSQMLEWLNAGMRDAVVLQPTAYVKNQSVALVAGTKQDVPSNAVSFIDMRRNMGVDGITPGRVPRFIDIKTLDSEMPNWHSSSSDDEVMHFCYDKRDPKRFYCWPPQPTVGQGYVEIVFSAVPEPLASASSVIPLDDIYANALIDYMLYRSYAKDPANEDKATKYYASFSTMVVGKKKLAKEAEPSIDKEA